LSHQPRNLVLSIQLGPWNGRTFAIPPGQIFTVGRREPANIKIEVDPAISGVHFEVENQGQAAWIRDLGSRNRTYVNKQAITSIELKDGDEIKAGKTVFQVLWECASIDPSLVEESKNEEISSPDENPTRHSPLQPAVPPPSIPFPSLIEETDYKRTSSFEPDDVEAEETPPRSHIPNREEVEVDFDFSAFDNYSRIDSPAGFNENTSSTKPRESSERFSGEAGIKKTQDSIVSNSLSEDLSVRSLSLYQSPASSFSVLLESLVDVAEFMVVPHFRKLGLDIPVGLDEVSLFPNLHNASQYLPVGVMGRNWVRGFNQKWTQQLVHHDGIVVLVGEECRGIASRLSRVAVEGFSMPNGFVGWYWPSQLIHMRSRMTKESLSEWLGEDWMALIYPDIDQSIISSIAKGQAGNVLERLGFERH
jgi:pSer/pThr/pTyr-binding forkhead associated (FHA) protein